MPNSFTKNSLFGNLLQDAEVANAFAQPNVLREILRFEQAWTEALIKVGMVSAADGALALDAIKRFPIENFEAAEIEKDGLPLPEIVRQLRRSCDDAGKGAIHSGATSQDVIDTAMLLICRALFTAFQDRIDTILDTLAGLQAQFGQNQMMGRTRMQAALPITVSDRLSTWMTPLAALRQPPEAGTVQVGGPVGLRDMPHGQDIATHVAAALGLQTGAVWHTDRGSFFDIGHQLTKISGALGKMGQDIALMAQQGVDELKLSGGGTSSAMPHKQNPVRAETLVSLSRYVAVQQGGLGQALVHEQERSGAAWTLEWLILPAMFEATGAALNNTVALTAQIERIGKSEP